MLLLVVAMFAGMALIRVAFFLLLAVSGALCQQRRDAVTPNSLPDAPSALASTQPDSALGITEEAVTSLAVASMPPPEMGTIARPTRSEFRVLYEPAPAQKDSNDLFAKYLYPSLLKRNLNYRPSTTDGLMSRAMYAASRIFITHDETGKAAVNTPYLVGVLSVAALHVAYRPYWHRSAAAPFSDFGSTIGNDAGMNLLHEFRPGLEQLMKNHTPRFVSRIEESIGR
jgi:hypothetical protein